MFRTSLLFVLLCCCVLFPRVAGAEQVFQVNPQLLEGVWPSNWIACPGESRQDYGVFHFRKTLKLDAKPGKFIIHTSADNRYKLYVNGEFAGEGPSRGDLWHWRFESYDISDLLQAGDNVIAAEVWNFSEYAPCAQMTMETGFLVQGDTEGEYGANTGKGSIWKVLKNEAYSPIPINSETMHAFTVVGPGDCLDANKYPWGWKELEYDDSGWSEAESISDALPSGQMRSMESYWHLVPRTLPAMERTPQPAPLVRRSEGIELYSGKRFAGAEIPAGSKVTIVLDQQQLTTAYPVLTLSGGRDASVRITYAEAMVDNNNEKGNRDNIDGKHVFGYFDDFISDGGQNRKFTTLWWRTFRYIKLEVKTAGEPLKIESLTSVYTGYPFELKAKFTSDDKSLDKITQVGWHTARLCAGETYFDCPYYEQLNYAGDTRIQSLISLYAAGDGSLARKVITLFDDSRMPMGLTQSRYPSYMTQVIPPYSLFWIAMIHDWWMLRGEPEFVRSMLPGIRGVIGWFADRLAPSGMLGALEWWNFVDWTPEYPMGVSPGADEGENAVISLQFVYTLQMASRMAAASGQHCDADWYAMLAGKVGRATILRCWDESRGLLAETPKKDMYSQHANVMAVLCGLLPGREREVMQRVLDEPDLVQCTFYYRFYLNQALKKAGMADIYLDNLDPWYNQLSLGLTTFAEKPEPTRSDCHAWSASPVHDFLALVCGITSDAPGFAKVRIEPSLGRLQQAQASMPHPAGEIACRLERKGNSGLVAEITLPPETGGVLVWNGSSKALVPGKQELEF